MFAFDRLKANFQSLLQDCSKSRPLCKRRRSKGVEVVCKHLQSSTNIKRNESETDRGRSFMSLSVVQPDVAGSREEDSPSIDVS